MNDIRQKERKKERKRKGLLLFVQKEKKNINIQTTIRLVIKGTGHDFCWSGKPIYHLQKQENIDIFQNKLQNPHKFAEIMKKNRVFGKFHS